LIGDIAFVIDGFSTALQHRYELWGIFLWCGSAGVPGVWGLSQKAPL